jgi:hypothetical protein
MNKVSELTNILYLNGRLIPIDSENYSNRCFPRRVTNNFRNLRTMKKIINTQGRPGGKNNINIQAVMSSIRKAFLFALFISVLF